MKKKELKVALVMGSDSDYSVVKDSILTLKKFDIPYEVLALSAHRSPDMVGEFAKSAENKGFGVIIAAAGKAAHLGGVIASYTPLPVIGLPIKSSTMDGLDSLLSMVQMPAGVPVATVAINGAVNAALLAIQILSLTDENIMLKLKEYKENLAGEVERKNSKLKKTLEKEGL